MTFFKKSKVFRYIFQTCKKYYKIYNVCSLKNKKNRQKEESRSFFEAFW